MRGGRCEKGRCRSRGCGAHEPVDDEGVVVRGCLLPCERKRQGDGEGVVSWGEVYVGEWIASKVVVSSKIASCRIERHTRDRTNAEDKVQSRKLGI